MWLYYKRLWSQTYKKIFVNCLVWCFIYQSCLFIWTELSSCSVVEWFPVTNSKLLFRVHAVQRMFERDVSMKKVLGAIKTGETIEDYSSEMPEPSRLILGFQGKRPFHVVTSENLEANETTIITVYIPDPNKWNKDSRSRRWRSRALNTKPTKGHEGKTKKTFVYLCDPLW